MNFNCILIFLVSCLAVSPHQHIASNDLLVDNVLQEIQSNSLTFLQKLLLGMIPGVGKRDIDSEEIQRILKEFTEKFEAIRLEVFINDPSVTEAKLRKSIRFLMNAYLASLNDHANNRKIFVNVQSVLNKLANLLVAALDSCLAANKPEKDEFLPEKILNEFKQAVDSLQEPEWV